MTKLKVDYNGKPITEAEAGDFFTDRNNHFYYCIKKGKIVDLFTKKYFDCTRNNNYTFYNENNYVHIHTKVEIKIIE